MNKKIVTLIIVILISFCFLSFVVADNVTHDDNNATDDEDIPIDNSTDEDIPIDNSTDDGSKKNYILAKGNGNNIKFSDGFRGFILDYSKSPASSGDEFIRVPTSYASNSNTLKLVVIECYKQNSVGMIGKVIADFVKTGSSNTAVGKAVASSHDKVSDNVIVRINDHTEAVFHFEVLKSASGNESDYFAYTVTLRTIDDGESSINQTSDLSYLTNMTNATNITNMTQSLENETNATFLDDLFDFFAFLANTLYDDWEPILDTLINDFLMIGDAIEGVIKFFEGIWMEIQSFFDAFEQLLKILDSISGALDGILKLLTMLLNAVYMIIDLLKYIIGLISYIISLVQQILGLLIGVINFITDIINQIMSLIQAISDLFKSTGNSLSTVIDNAASIIIAFVIITIGAFVYNRIR